MQVNPDCATRLAAIKQALSSLVQEPPGAASVEAIYLFYSNTPAWRIDICQLFKSDLPAQGRRVYEAAVCDVIDCRKQADRSAALLDLWHNARV